MRKSINWRGLNKLIRLAKKMEKMEDTNVIRHGGAKFFFAFYLFVSFKKKLLTKQKLNLYSDFLIGQYNFIQYVLSMIFTKFGNRDKTSSKVEQVWFLLLQWVEKTNGK